MLIKKKIKDWSVDDRPREKLLKYGEKTLSDSELLAILLGTGNKEENVIDLSRRILSKFRTFRNMSCTDIRDWKEFKGLGKAKITLLRASIEIARRFNEQEDKEKRVKITTTEEVVRLFKPKMRDLKYEVVKIVFCNARNEIIDVSDITNGTPTESYPTVREIISKALQNFASGVICMHNHPMGESSPSKDDEIFTKSLKEAGKLMGIDLLEHIIFGEEMYYSFDKSVTKGYEKIC